MKKVDMIIDLQFGSTGKGLIAGYLAETRRYDVVINANMPNAGHTYINAMGRKWMHKVLPNGIVSPNLKYVLLGPGSIFSLDRLMFEMEQSMDLLMNRDVVVKIHPNAVILDDDHAVQEAHMVNTIGSTAQGSMAAMIEKLKRDPNNNPTAAKVLPERGLGGLLCSYREWMDIIEYADNILAEGAQGFSLGINQEFYPFCTSRECTPSRFLSDMGIPHTMLKEVIGTARTYPIRVGGNSGGYYGDQSEVDWSDLGVAPELTTVTKRERRVFTYSRTQIEKAIWHCRPDSVFLNFCNYMKDRGDSIENDINSLFYNKYGVKWKGFGPTSSDIKVR